MKLFIAAATLSVSHGALESGLSVGGRRAAWKDHLDKSSIGGTRRYDQLVSMMGHFNKDFDEKKFWTYGCNCLMLGDRPMSDLGHGQAVDAIDKTCKRYKECLKCAREKWSEDCIGESQRYGWKIGPEQSVMCNNQKSSCKRAICECDKMFAMEHAGVADSYDENYHMFWTQTGWNHEENCVHGTEKTNSQCCGSDGAPSYMYNADNKYCCDGMVSPTTCPAY
jgi:hypothetical protein